MFASLMWPQELRNTQELGNKNKTLDSKDRLDKPSDIDGVAESP